MKNIAAMIFLSVILVGTPIVLIVSFAVDHQPIEPSYSLERPSLAEGDHFVYSVSRDQPRFHPTFVSGLHFVTIVEVEKTEDGLIYHKQVGYEKDGWTQWGSKITKMNQDLNRGNRDGEIHERMRFPLQESSWSYEHNDNRYEVTLTHAGKITVPAGTFDTWKTESVPEEEGAQRWGFTGWYAPEIGYWVKFENWNVDFFDSHDLEFIGQGDDDNDGVGNAIEQHMGWNPNQEDTDGDGSIDSADIRVEQNIRVNFEFGDFEVYENPDAPIYGMADPYMFFRCLIMSGANICGTEDYVSEPLRDVNEGDFEIIFDYDWPDHLKQWQYVIKMFDDDSQDTGELEDDEIDVADKHLMINPMYQIADGGAIEFGEWFTLRGSASDKFHGSIDIRLTMVNDLEPPRLD